MLSLHACAARPQGLTRPRTVHRPTRCSSVQARAELLDRPPGAPASLVEHLHAVERAHAAAEGEILLTDAEVVQVEAALGVTFQSQALLKLAFLDSAIGSDTPASHVPALLTWLSAPLLRLLAVEAAVDGQNINWQTDWPGLYNKKLFRQAASVLLPDDWPVPDKSNPDPDGGILGKNLRQVLPALCLDGSPAQAATLLDRLAGMASSTAEQPATHAAGGAAAPEQGPGAGVQLTPRARRFRQEVLDSCEWGFLGSDEMGPMESYMGYSFAEPRLLGLGLSSGIPYGWVWHKETCSKLDALGSAVLGLFAAEGCTAVGPKGGAAAWTDKQPQLMSARARAGRVRVWANSGYLLSKYQNEGGEKFGDRLAAKTLHTVVAAAYLDGGLVAARDFVFRCCWTS